MDIFRSILGLGLARNTGKTHFATMVDNSVFRYVPIEMLEHIFGFLPLRDLTSSVPFVCMRFYQASERIVRIDRRRLVEDEVKRKQQPLNRVHTSAFEFCVLKRQDAHPRDMDLISVLRRASSYPVLQGIRFLARCQGGFEIPSAEIHAYLRHCRVDPAHVGGYDIKYGPINQCSLDDDREIAYWFGAQFRFSDAGSTIGGLNADQAQQHLIDHPDHNNKLGYEFCTPYNKKQDRYGKYQSGFCVRSYIRVTFPMVQALIWAFEEGGFELVAMRGMDVDEHGELRPKPRLLNPVWLYTTQGVRYNELTTPSNTTESPVPRKRFRLAIRHWDMSLSITKNDGSYVSVSDIDRVLEEARQTELLSELQTRCVRGTLYLQVGDSHIEFRTFNRQEEDPNTFYYCWRSGGLPSVFEIVSGQNATLEQLTTLLEIFERNGFSLMELVGLKVDLDGTLVDKRDNQGGVSIYTLPGIRYKKFRHS